MYDLEREREYIELASLEADLTPEEEYEFYTKYALRTKEDLLSEIKVTKSNFRRLYKAPRSEEFYHRLNKLFDLFYEEVDSHVIMEPLDNFWGYEFEVRDTGITLKLAHLVPFYDEPGDDYVDFWKYYSAHYFTDDDRYSIIEVRAKFLTLEEYGKAYDVEAGTVRQWIRRGKLKSAAKFSNGWQIPELADKPTRGYIGAHYYWKADFPDPPLELPEINEGDSVDISKNTHTGKWTVTLDCLRKKGPSKAFTLDNKDKEKLELFLISHPLVECGNSYLCEINQKAGSQYEMLKRDPRIKTIEEIDAELDEELGIHHRNRGMQEGME